MHRAFTLFFLLVSLPASAMVEPEAIKLKIEEKKKCLSEAAELEKAQAYYELSLAYLADQEIDLAFRNFLEALKFVDKSDVKPQLNEEEARIYDEAIRDYFAAAGSDPMQSGELLLRRYGRVASEHPEYIYLNFLITAAHANLCQYRIFFEKFFQAYPCMHQSFLAYKTQGILYLRLSQRCSELNDRRQLEHEAIHYLSQALVQNSQDPSIYKILIYLAMDEKNDTLLKEYLEQIIANNVAIPRGDIFPFVREAIALRAFELAQAIIDQASNVYGYSRAVASAQEYLNEQRG